MPSPPIPKQFVIAFPNIIEEPDDRFPDKRELKEVFQEQSAEEESS